MDFEKLEDAPRRAIKLPKILAAISTITVCN